MRAGSVAQKLGEWRVKSKWWEQTFMKSEWAALLEEEIQERT